MKANIKNLISIDDLFTSEAERQEERKPKVDEIPLNELIPFENHPFQVKDDEEMQELIKSIAASGVLVPGLARKKKDGTYELVAGHRRLAACKALGMATMPVIFQDFTDEEAVITMVDSNLQREHILPSEKAFAYKMKLDAMKHQGRTSTQLAQKLSAQFVGDVAGESKDTVRRFIRLTSLIPELLKMVDEGKIALTPAVELSYLQPSEQEALLAVMESDEATPSLSQAQRLRRMSEENAFSESSAAEVLSEVKGNQVEYVKFPAEKIRGFFRPDTSIKQMTDTIVKAMEYYNKYLARQRREKEREER